MAPLKRNHRRASRLCVGAVIVSVALGLAQPAGADTPQPEDHYRAWEADAYFDPVVNGCVRTSAIAIIQGAVGVSGGEHFSSTNTVVQLFFFDVCANQSIGEFIGSTPRPVDADVAPNLTSAHLHATLPPNGLPNEPPVSIDVQWTAAGPVTISNRVFVFHGAETIDIQHQHGKLRDASATGTFTQAGKTLYSGTTTSAAMSNGIAGHTVVFRP
jgi:hypothetical protein